MKTLLESKLSLLKLATVISYLLIYTSGEKYGMFLFMILILYPFLMIDGSSNIFSLNLPQPLIVLTDTLFLLFTYIFIFIFFRSRSNSNQSNKNRIACILGILYFYIEIIRILYTSQKSIFSLITIGVFIVISITTLTTLLISKPNN